MTMNSNEHQRSSEPENSSVPLTSLEKKCTYCDTSMPIHARVCSNCNRDQRWYLNHFRVGDLLLFVFLLISFGVVYFSYRNFQESTEERVKASQALERTSAVENIVKQSKEQLEQLQRASEEGRKEVDRITSLVKEAETKLANVEDVTKETKQKAQALSKQSEEYQKDIRAKTARILELERQAKVIRTIDGNIECVFSGDWRKHPGSIVPIGWNKAQIYARIFERNETENEAILFLLENMRMMKLPDGNLKVNIEVRAKSGTGLLGQEFDVFKKYSHLSVYVPFIDRNATFDNRIMLRELSALFFVNGEKRFKLNQVQGFEIPIPEGKALGFQLNTKGLFTDLDD